MARSLANDLPEETDTGGFDVVAENQGISPLHVRSYLTAAAGALDEALRTGPRPETRTYEIDYSKSPYLPRNSVGEYLGAGIVKIVDDAAADLIGRIGLLFNMVPLILETDSSRVISIMIQDHAPCPRSRA